MNASCRQILQWLCEGPRSLLPPQDPAGLKSWYEQESQILLQVPSLRKQSESLTLYRLFNSDRMLVRTFRGILTNDAASATSGRDEIEVAHFEIDSQQRLVMEGHLRSLALEFYANAIAELSGTMELSRTDEGAAKTVGHIFRCRFVLFGSWQRMACWVNDDHPLASHWQNARKACDEVLSSCSQAIGYCERFDALPAHDHLDLWPSKLGEYLDQSYFS